MPSPELVPALLRRRASEAGSALAFRASEDTLGWRDVLAEAESLAGVLAASGVQRGDRLALVMPAGLDFVRAVFAAQLAGAASCAVNPGLPPATALRRAALVRPKLVLAGEELAAALTGALAGAAASAAPPLYTESSLRRGIGAAPPPPAAPAPDELAFLQLTSGTTGEPRAAMVSHRALAAYLVAFGAALRPTPRDALVVWVPPWHDLGLVYGLFAPLAGPCPAHLVRPAIATIPLWLQTISRHGGTITGAPDFAYRLACRLVEPGDVDLRRLRCATSGGEPVRLQTILAFERRFGVPGVVRPGYGQAEATLGLAYNRAGRPLRTAAGGAVSCGQPMPGVQLRIVDDAGRELPPGERGEIAARTPSAFSGYFDAPEDTAAAWRDGWLLTGDAGLLDRDGELYVLGRRRALLKRAGSALAPRELEEVAETVPGIRASAAVGIADPDAGERIVLVAESAAEDTAGRAEVAAAVAAAIRDALGFAPEVRVVPPRGIPRTENGKVRHSELRRRLET